MKDLKNLAPYLRKYKFSIYWGFVFVTISNICSTYIPRLVGHSVDMLSNKSFVREDVIINIIYILALTLGSGLFMYLTRQTIIKASRLIEYDLRKDLFESIAYKPASFFQSNSTGSLMALTTNDIPAAREFLGPAVMYGANSITTFAFAMYFMLSLSPMITLITILPLPIIALATYFIGKKIHIAFRDVQKSYADLTEQSQETFSGIRIIKAYVREANERKLFSELSKDYLKKNIVLGRLQAIIMPLFTVLVGLSIIFTLAYGGKLVMDGKAGLGVITQFFIYLGLLIWPVAAIGWITNIIQRAAASTARIFKIFDQDKINESEDKGEKIDIKGQIEFKNVSLKYGENLPKVLENINLKIPAGSTLGITGPVGSGKSSFINLISSIYSCSEGDILIDGLEIEKINLKTLRNAIGVVSQEPFLFSDTIENNVKFGKFDATKEEVLNASRLAELHEEVETFDLKYDTLLGERGVTLSGGQRQRTALARAIITNTPILILDDSLSAVDSRTESKIIENLQSVMKDRTTIIVSHRISALKSADNIIVIQNGKIVDSGTHEELISRTGYYQDIYQRSALMEEIESM